MANLESKNVFLWVYLFDFNLVHTEVSVRKLMNKPIMQMKKLFNVGVLRRKLTFQGCAKVVALSASFICFGFCARCLACLKHAKWNGG